MASLYTAKFNINEKIYKVQDGEESLEELLSKIFNNLNQNERILDDKDENIVYKFVNLHHNEKDMVIDGDIVKIYDGINSSYDESEDKVVDEHAINKADYVSFSFDVRKEIIGFVPKQTFSKESFIKYFKLLVEKCVPEVGFVVIILITDAGALDDKFKRMKIMRELEVKIIPSNGDENNFADILDIIGDDIKDSNAQHLGINLKGTIKEPLVKNSKLIQELKEVAKKAYAKIRAVGRDSSDQEFVIDSEKDALLKRNIRDDNRNSLTEIADLTQESAEVYIAQRGHEVIRLERGEERTIE